MSITEKAVKLKNESDLHAPRLLSGAEIAYRIRLAFSGENFVKALPTSFVEPEMPPVSDSQSEDDVLTHPEPQEPEAAGFEVIGGVPINTKKRAVTVIFSQLLKSCEIDGIKIERLTSRIVKLASERFPRFSKITAQDVNYALKDLEEFKPYHRQKTKSVKTFSASGEKTRYMLEGSQSVDEDSQEAVDAKIDLEKRQKAAKIESLIRSQRECGKHGN